jgi:hypothetical protein
MTVYVASEAASSALSKSRMTLTLFSTAARSAQVKCFAHPSAF